MLKEHKSLILISLQKAQMSKEKLVLIVLLAEHNLPLVTGTLSKSNFPDSSIAKEYYV